MTNAARRARELRRAEVAFHTLAKHRGVYKAAADELLIGETTLRKRIGDYCRIYGYVTPFEAAYHAHPQENTSIFTAADRSAS